MIGARVVGDGEWMSSTRTETVTHGGYLMRRTGRRRRIGPKVDRVSVSVADGAWGGLNGHAVGTTRSTADLETGETTA